MSTFRLALHSVSYAGFWPGQARLDLPGFLAKARELGYGEVMLMAKRPHLSVLDHTPAEARQLKQQLDDLGLKVACLAGYTEFAIGGERPEIPLREMQILYVRELARLASELGSPLGRVFTSYDSPHHSFDATWRFTADALRECAVRAAEFGVSIGVQNHHDFAVHHDLLADLLDEIDHPACGVMFDAWAPSLHGVDPVAGVRRLGGRILHTTVADYVKRPRFQYVPNLVNYEPRTDVVRAVPMGEGFIDHRAFFAALREVGYAGTVAYEMCSMLRGGGAVENLDSAARRFREWMGQV
jgi:sugar phosphate isomerase/epimerase